MKFGPTVQPVSQPPTRMMTAAIRQPDVLPHGRLLRSTDSGMGRVCKSIERQAIDLGQFLFLIARYRKEIVMRTALSPLPALLERRMSKRARHPRTTYSPEALGSIFSACRRAPFLWIGYTNLSHGFSSRSGLPGPSSPSPFQALQNSYAPKFNKAGPGAIRQGSRLHKGSTAGRPRTNTKNR